MISIIIPVYNAQKYLSRCIDSILVQTYQEYEILIIDDGSVDSSAELCDRYALEDTRIRVFHTKNKGVSSARNLGLRNATGEWICFVDADDALPRNALKCMISNASDKTDIIIGDFEYIIRDNTTLCRHPEYKGRDEFIENYIASDWVMICGCIINASIFKANEISFPEGIKFSEDFYTMCAVLTHCSNIVCVDECVYTYYRDNETSATTTDIVFQSKHQRNAFSRCINDFSATRDFKFLERGICWKLLQAEQLILSSLDGFNKFRHLYPEKEAYLWSCPYISRKMKILMWCILRGHDKIALMFYRLKRKVVQMNCIPVVFAFDNNLAMPAAVCIYSLFASARPETEYAVYIMHRKGELLDTTHIDKVFDLYPSHSLKMIEVDGTFDSSFEIRGITTPAYYRLLIPTLIPEYDRVIYSDVDVIFRQDLSAVYNMDLEGNLIAGVNNLAHIDADLKKHYYGELGLDPETVICSGFLIMDSQKIREACMVDNFVAEARKRYKFQDQDVLNIVCRGRIKQLPPKYSVLTYIANVSARAPETLAGLWTEDEVAEAMREGNIHYNGQKPWRGYCINFDIWWEYYRKSPIFDSRYYFDFFDKKLNEFDRLPLMKRVKILLRYFIYRRS